MAATKASTPIFSSDRRQDEALDCPFSSSYEPMPSTSPPPAKAEPSRLKERRGAGSTKRHLEAGGCRSKASDLSSDRVDKAMPAAFKIKAWGGGWPSHPIHWKRIPRLICPHLYQVIYQARNLLSNLRIPIPRNPIHLFLVRASTAQLLANQQPPSN